MATAPARAQPSRRARPGTEVGKKGPGKTDLERKGGARVSIDAGGVGSDAEGGDGGDGSPAPVRV